MPAEPSRRADAGRGVLIGGLIFAADRRPANRGIRDDAK